MTIAAAATTTTTVSAVILPITTYYAIRLHANRPYPDVSPFLPIVPSHYRPQQRSGDLPQSLGQCQGPRPSFLLPMFGSQSSPVCGDQKNRIQVARRILEGNPTSIRVYV